MGRWPPPLPSPSRILRPTPPTTEWPPTAPSRSRSTKHSGLRSGRLRKLNRLRDGQTLIVGRRLNLEFSNTTPERFEQQRIAYQQTRQLEYFARHQIAGVIEHPIAEGDSLWQLAVQQYDIPLWLLRQYNPDIDTDTVLPLQSVVYVPVVEALPDRQPCLRAQAETITEGDA